MKYISRLGSLAAVVGLAAVMLVPCRLLTRSYPARTATSRFNGVRDWSPVRSRR
jgi:hypothetical protein